MGTVVMGHEIGPRLIELLGLPERTRSCKITFKPDKCVTIKCEYYADGDGVTKMIELMSKEYVLYQKEIDVTNLGSLSKEFVIDCERK